MTRDFHMPGRSEVIAQNGLCATSHPLAAKTAIDILERGGNAADAAIAAAVLLGLCEPQMTGLGGDCFVLIDKPGKGLIGLNGSGRAPAGLDADALRASGLTRIPDDHPAAITLPGAVDAFCRLNADHGRLSLAEILAPAIHYAEEGVPVAPRTAQDWAAGSEYLSGMARKFFLASGQALRPGQVFRAPVQAKVLREIAAKGRAGFYDGPVAADMLATLRALGGPHSAEDFAAVHADYVTPLVSRYKDHELIELPPNGQGAAAMLLCNILAEFDLAALDPTGADRAHIEAEATKLAYEARNRFIADPDHATGLDQMLDRDTGHALAGLIDPAQAAARATNLTEAVHRDTIYLSVVDRDRMAVSMIYSIFRSFGSGHASETYGILFHNRGAGFTLAPGHPNEAGAGKRPLHTIIPGMIRTPDASLISFGVMGGAYQANGHARFLTNLVDFNMGLQEAIEAPRSFAYEGELRLERGYGPDIARNLAERGHRIVIPDGPIGGAQAVRIDATEGVLVGASDHRKDGLALGY